MPIFPGPVSHNNPNAPILDATGNQIKGFGVFADTDARAALNESLRAVGFLAIVGSPPVAFIYVGGDWANNDSWKQVGHDFEIVQDLSPQLGGNLDVNGQSIVSTNNQNIVFTPNGTGHITLDGCVQFKRFPFDAPPNPEAGKMYADTNDDLFFGIT